MRINSRGLSDNEPCSSLQERGEPRKKKQYLQDPDVGSPRSFCKKVLSASVVLPLRRLVDFSASSTFSCTANLCSIPGSVGKKKGAFSSGFGDSFGLFRCYNPVDRG